MEREKLNSIMSEMKLSETGLVNEADAGKIGNLIGADALITGSGHYDVVDKVEKRSYKDKKGKRHTYYTLKRKISTVLNYRVFNVKTGVIVASKTIKNSLRKQGSRGASPAAARENIVNWRDLVSKSFDDITTKLVFQIAPHYVQESRKIEEGEAKQLKSAAQAAKRGLWEDALPIWEEIYNNKSDFKPEDVVAATYDMGIYYEINGNLDKAFELFSECYRKSGKNTYLDAKARINHRKRELEKLKKQQGTDGNKS